MVHPGVLTNYIKVLKHLALGSMTLLLTLGCNEKNKTKTSTPETRIKRNIPAFNSDSAYVKIEKQLSFGFRVPGTAAHQETVEWIIKAMESYGAKVLTQDFKANFFNRQDVPCTNIIAQFNPLLTQRVLLAAHFDSRLVAEKDDERKDQPIPGADDGASGTAVLMEIGRMISENPIDIGVDLVFFDAEDQGSAKTNWAQGSQYWSKNLMPIGYIAKFGILLDMVGSEKAAFGKEEYSRQLAPELQDKVWTLAKNMGYSDYFQEFYAGGVMDDHVYVNQYANIPMIDIINISPEDRVSFGEYHHTHDDDIDIISKRTLRVVGQVVTAVLYNESNGTF